MKKQIFQCYIKTVSPIHIGCDEVYEPTGFAMDEQNRQLVVFNSIDFIDNLSKEDRNHFTDICSKGSVSSILELYKFLRNRPAEGRKVDVCIGFLEHYKKTVSMSTGNERRIQNELNNFSIPRTSFLQIDKRPYLPGSSIKGSLRTAYINLCSIKQGARKKTYSNAKKMEKDLINYNGIPDDPFRLVKVSDFSPVGEVKTKIIYGVNKKKKVTDKDPQGMPLLFEIIQPGAIFTGMISVEEPEKKAKIKIPVTLETLLQGALSFYSSEKKREDQELSVIGINNFTNNKEKTTFLRCGRHSGAESVTIKGHRSINIMEKKGGQSKNKDKTTTIWLASDVKKSNNQKNLHPFGWSELHEISDENKNEFSLKEQTYQEKLQQEKYKKNKEAEKKQKLEDERIEAEKKKAKEIEKKRIAEENRKAEFEKMSPEQKFLAELEDSALTRNRVFEIYNQLDDISEEWQKKVANALKEYWMTHGNWKKKECSKKQLVKIEKIKIILGDVT